MNTDDAPRWFSLEEACSAASVSRSTLERWRRSGLPTVPVGGRVLIDPDDLRAFINSFETSDGSTSSSPSVPE